jgi:hypothetical protein
MAGPPSRRALRINHRMIGDQHAGPRTRAECRRATGHLGPDLLPNPTAAPPRCAPSPANAPSRIRDGDKGSPVVARSVVETVRDRRLRGPQSLDIVRRPTRGLPSQFAVAGCVLRPDRLDLLIEPAPPHRRICTSIDRLSSVGGSLPILAIAMGAQVEKPRGSRSSPSHRHTDAVARVWPEFSIPRMSSEP